MHGLVSLKSRFACVLFMAQPSHNSRGSVLPQLGPLCSPIHSSVSWVRWPEPSWILSLGFIGWQLIYPLYTFQIIGLSLQGRKKEPQRGKTCFESSFPPPEASAKLRKCSITAAAWYPKLPLHPSFPHEVRRSARCCFIFMQPTEVHPGTPNLRCC